MPNLPSEALTLEYVNDREYLAKVLVDAKPTSEAGKQLAYHAISGGFIIGEVVHQVTGKSIRDVLREEFLDPLGFRWTNYGVAPEDTEKVALNYLTGPTTLPPLSTLLQRALGAPLDELVETTNDDRFVTGVVPAGNLVTTAHELSRFFEVMRCGGELDGVRVIETDTIRKALEEQSHLEIDFSLGFPTRFSYGLMLGAQLLEPLRARHTARVRAPRFHEHPGLGGPAARDLGRGAHERQADPLPRAAALPDAVAAHHLGVAQGGRLRDLALSVSLDGAAVQSVFGLAHLSRVPGGSSIPTCLTRNLHRPLGLATVLELAGEGHLRLRARIVPTDAFASNLLFFDLHREGEEAGSRFRTAVALHREADEGVVDDLLPVVRRLQLELKLPARHERSLVVLVAAAHRSGRDQHENGDPCQGQKLLHFPHSLKFDATRASRFASLFSFRDALLRDRAGVADLATVHDPDVMRACRRCG